MGSILPRSPPRLRLLFPVYNPDVGSSLAGAITMKHFPALFLSFSFALFVSAKEIRIGLIGLDTSHVVAFTKITNDPKAIGPLAGAKVVAAFKGGSLDIPSSAGRIEKFTKTLTEDYGLKLYPTIAELCKNVDAVMIGRGALRNPGIFNECIGLNNDSSCLKIIRRYQKSLKEYYDTRFSLILLRKFSAWLAFGNPGAAKFRKNMFECVTTAEVMEKVEAFFQNENPLPFDDNEEFMMSGHG